MNTGPTWPPGTRCASFKQLLVMACSACLLALFPLPGLGAQAQESQSAAAAMITAPMVQSRLDQVQASSVYDEKTRTAAIDLYRQVLTNLDAVQLQRDAAARFERLRESAPQQLEELRKSLPADRDVNPLTSLDIDQGTPARDIEQRLQQARAAAAAAQAGLADAEQNLASVLARPQAARQRQAAIEQETRELAAQMTQALPEGESDVVMQARAWVLQTAARALTEEARKLDQELLSQDIRVELLEVERDQARRDLEVAQARIAALQPLLTERRLAETARVIDEAGIEGLGMAAVHPELQDLLEKNRALGQQLADLTQRLAQVTQKNEQAEADLEALERRYENARQKLEFAGVSPALGAYLAKELRSLPELSNHHHNARERETRVTEANLRAMRLDESLQEFRDPGRKVATLLQEVADGERPELEAPLTRLADAHRDLLKTLSDVNDDYLRALSEYEYTELRYYNVVRDYSAFLSKRLMWVRSQPPLTPVGLLELPGQVASYLKPTHWAEAIGVFTQRLYRSPLQMFGVLIILVFWWKLGALRRALRETAARVGKPSEDTFSSTIKALGITVLMTLPWPLFAGITGYELSTSWQATPASRVVGLALLEITPLLFFLRGFRILCTAGGVAESHFRWAPSGLAMMRRQIDLLMLTVLLPAVMMITAAGFAEPTGTTVLGQVIFVVLIGGLMLFLYRLLVPGRGILYALRRRSSDETDVSWPWFWLLIALLLPVGLGLMALGGYMYSAGTLLNKLVNTTLWLVFGLVLLRELAVRWLLVMRRRLLLREALQRREAARAAKQSDTDTPTLADETGAGTAEPSVNVASLDVDTRKLLNVALTVTGVLGLGAIWSGVMPALGALSDITLWQISRQVGDQQQIQVVTLADILVAMLSVVLTLVAAKNVPALLEIVLRQRPSITPGSRLAFATLARYGVAGIGTAFVLARVGVDWSKLQWLVAALGVGIGFGLQEIVANFISGLIILLERPVRVGDIVTVGDASGVVTRVQIRATTIRTWDRQELLVPNKEFITGRVLNWSLTDDILRIYFIVGVAYGSDVERALELIEEAAREHPTVLDDPAPFVTFEAFGDNTLNLGLRCFVPSLDERLQTVTDLHRAINRKFNDAGIVIAFPQRDVHLDTNSPLEVRVLRGADTPGSNA